MARRNLPQKSSSQSRRRRTRRARSRKPGSAGLRSGRHGSADRKSVRSSPAATADKSRRSPRPARRAPAARGCRRRPGSGSGCRRSRSADRAPGRGIPSTSPGTLRAGFEPRGCRPRDNWPRPRPAATGNPDRPCRRRIAAAAASRRPGRIAQSPLRAAVLRARMANRPAAAGNSNLPRRSPHARSRRPPAPRRNAAEQAARRCRQHDPLCRVTGPPRLHDRRLE